MPDLQTLPFTPSSPWIRALVAQPNTAIRIPSNRVSKLSTEDSLFAETLQTSRTFPECFIFYRDPALSAPRSSSSGTSGEDAESRIQEVHFLVRVGDGLNGHPAILHGGIVAALVDEGMGVLQTVNHERAHARSVQREKEARGERGEDDGRGRVSEGSGDGLSSLPPLGSFTAELKIRYRRPVSTPGEVLCTARYVRREGRKEWIEAAIRQGEVEGDGVVDCAIGEGLFVEPKKKDAKL
ncbi:hypothetical protein KC332_g7915 [Hortaea werneckii]|uniref:Uncharacterized protein n=2 Tax=Hortaea werneckii TaxID=91943 RepID=A0A3M7IFQ7_HORWE|nr:hypothetical protein KC358_g11254 [Hortaea werneckii]OTA34525.1 hypothetical protein BTJ68_04067 [Hortaea werneckii EXF-2000]KAI6832355.1 hypothetical protein KC350_g7157 [Hortaea werneckii]KAI6928287.1 hypothetical protein KC348_g8152 [Hortaea werneckii]KAI6934488.1 hypothetical protein KC341_g7568 [Hortaea werneckii]